MGSALTTSLLIIAIVTYGYLGPRMSAKRYYTILNFSFALFCLAFVSLSGVSWKEMGFKFNAVPIFIALCLLVLALFIILVLSHAQRVKLRPAEYRELLVRIPIGTALSEEIIFRAALLTSLLQSFSRLWALVISSLIFGFWHLLPQQDSVWALQNMNYKKLSPALVKLSSGSITVAVTTLGGIFFGWLRLASGGILLPWVFHTVINDVSWTCSKAVSMSELNDKFRKVKASREKPVAQR